MLDAFIIEQIRRREEKAREQQRPFLELPLSQPRVDQDEAPVPRPKDEPDRGVIVIDFA